MTLGKPARRDRDRGHHRGQSAERSFGGGKSLRVPYMGLKGDYHELPAINPTFTDINPSLDNPSLRPESRPFCSGPPPTQPPCCRQPWPGSCGWSIGRARR